MTSGQSTYTDLSDFIEDRAPWLRVTTMVNENGGHDVVLRIDGSYPAPGQIAELFGDPALEAAVGGAADAADYFRAELEPLLVALGLEGRLLDWAA